ncbi:hypothetical protein D0T08_23855 [Emticicia sp. C21]|nr:hypothetical protein D0T08_23855 [Emticicia sp. C21]
MGEEKNKKANLDGRGITDYRPGQVVWECVKLPANQAESEKVTSSEKVTNMVGTFWKLTSIISLRWHQKR